MLVCMYVCQPKIVKCQFFYVFFPNSSLKDNFQNRGFEPYWIVSWVQGVSKCQYMYVCVGLKQCLVFFTFPQHFSLLELPRPTLAGACFLVFLVFEVFSTADFTCKNNNSLTFRKKATDLSLNPWQPYIKMNECSFTFKILVLIRGGVKKKILFFFQFR